MVWVQVVAKLWVLLLVAVQAKNYCTPELCENAPHIGCIGVDEFDSRCPHNIEMVDMHAGLQWWMVNTHNKHRDYVASGEDSHFNKSCRMGTMQWDDELAYLASLHVRNCVKREDSCHNTQTYRHSGQNVALIDHHYGLPLMHFALDEAVQTWFNEIYQCNRDIINNGLEPNLKYPVHHFTLMVTEHNLRMGCAAATYNMGIDFYLLLTCNYSTSNVYGRQIYAPCSKAGRECLTGKHREYTSLCSMEEEYDIKS